MTLNAAYFSLLNHLGTTATVAELASSTCKPLVAMRHDVDHDLDYALEMAYWERERGFRATYFLLPSAPYWNDPHLVAKALQLQDYGHEVGLHVNILAEWAAGSTDDPGRRLGEQLARLRDGGVRVCGIAAHGDRLCYEHDLANDWAFAELRPDDPRQTEDGRTAEGTRDPEGRRALRYPPDHTARRPDGASFALWSLSLVDYDVAYHAWHTRFDRYFSDSGGGWTRTPDPLGFEPGDERWQILIHPIHWRGQPRVYFFLSTARSGSKWLSEVLAAATPLSARHEYILNQPFHRGEAVEKPTGPDFRGLAEDPHRAEALLAEAWTEIAEMKSDYAEVNVYLERFLPLLDRYFPGAERVHLHRHPAAVVRSLMDRDWYDTPEDRGRPALPVETKEAATQFERVCHYVADVNHRLAGACDHELSLAELTRDVESLAAALRRLGIPLHARLAAPFIGQVINAARESRFPPYTRWTRAQRDCFAEICGPVLRDLGYSWGYGRAPIARIARRLQRWAARHVSSRESELVLVAELGAGVRAGLRAVNCALGGGDGEAVAVRRSADRKNAYVTLGGSNWHEACAGEDGPSGWQTRHSHYIAGTIRGKVRGEGRVMVFALSYVGDGRQLHSRNLGALDARRREINFAFAPRPDAARFDIALYLSRNGGAEQFDLRAVEVVMKPYLR